MLNEVGIIPRKLIPAPTPHNTASRSPVPTFPVSALIRHLSGIRRRMDSSNLREFGQAGQKERGARQPHKRLLYCVNVNRTSLDHLLLGRSADVDENVEWPKYSAGSGEMSELAFP